MKGILFNVVHEIVERNQGEDAWDRLIEMSGVGGSYTSLGSYPDSELVALIDAAAVAGGTTPQATMQYVGEHAIPLFYERYPALFARSGTMDLLLSLNDIIHPEVYKLYPGADPPTFSYDVVEPDHLVMGYSSARRMCALAEGLILGVGGHFGDTLSVTQTTCMLAGDPVCTLDVRIADGTG